MRTATNGTRNSSTLWLVTIWKSGDESGDEDGKGINSLSTSFPEMYSNDVRRQLMHRGVCNRTTWVSNPPIPGVFSKYLCTVSLNHWMPSSTPTVLQVKHLFLHDAVNRPIKNRRFMPLLFSVWFYFSLLWPHHIFNDRCRNDRGCLSSATMLCHQHGTYMRFKICSLYLSFTL